MKARLIVLWVGVIALALAALPFVLAAVTVHHATRSAGGGRGFHEGEL